MTERATPRLDRPPAPGMGVGVRLWAVVFAGFLLRLSPWDQVFVGNRILISGTDGYYHLRRAWLTLQQWPRVPQVDQLMSAPDGGTIQWPPLFDWLLATLALPFSSHAELSLEAVGALLPPVLGALELLLLFQLVRLLGDASSALWATLLAALLPAAVAPTAVGALDHDPLIGCGTLLALTGVARDAGAQGRGARSGLRGTGEVALGLTVLTLTWAGSVMHVGLLGVLVVVATALDRTAGSPRHTIPSAVGFGSLGAALATLPFVAGSVWTTTHGATFMGLSWLHSAGLLGLGMVGLGAAALLAGGRSWGLAVGSLFALVGTVVLLPSALPALLDGMGFLGKGEPFLQQVAESRPLLFLRGPFDLRPALVRLGGLPLLLPLLLLCRRRSGGWQQAGLAGAWAVYTLVLAGVQARYTHEAALALAAVGGMTLVDLGRRLADQGRRRLLALGAAGALLLLPAVAAYLPVPGFEGLRLIGRTNYVILSGMLEVGDFLRRQEPASPSWADPGAEASESVLAHWSSGHWIHWLGRRATVANPFGPQGQPGFHDGVRFFFLERPEDIRALLERRRARFVVAATQLPNVALEAATGGFSSEPFFATDPTTGAHVLRQDRLLRTVGARLAFFGPGEVEVAGETLPPLTMFRLVFTTAGHHRTPLGLVPLVRVYEVVE